jgi:hypothetical protein
MSSVLEYIEANPQEAQRLIGLAYPELQILLQNAEQLHHEKQALFILLPSALSYYSVLSNFFR